jgi:putative spermidine/putrescine transport system permease protein
MTVKATTAGMPGSRPASRRFSWAWLGVVPFFAFAIAFLFLPISFLVIGSFQENGQWSLGNYLGLGDDYIKTAYWNSIQVSAVTAILGGALGFLIAAAIVFGRLPRVLATGLLTFSGVASNFAGVPLALAFVFTIGNNGLITVLLKDSFGINLTEHFRIYTIMGISIVYMYFQLPLMILIIAPAIAGLRKDWQEAAMNLGATPRGYWRHVALPILMPSILGTVILLFGNAFGAQATVFQLTGGTIPFAPLVISSQIRGDVLRNPGMGYSMAMGMVAIMGVSILLYAWLQRRAERWQRS